MVFVEILNSIDQIIKGFVKCSSKKYSDKRYFRHRNISKYYSWALGMPDLLTNLNGKIETLERKIFNYAYVKNKFDIVILMAVSCIAEIYVVTLTAETDRFKDFSSGDKFALWL